MGLNFFVYFFVINLNTALERLKRSGGQITIFWTFHSLYEFKNADLSLSPTKRTYESDATTRRDCVRSGLADSSSCENFLGTLLYCPKSRKVEFCGTNAFKPILYSKKLGSSENVQKFDGEKACPSSPDAFVVAISDCSKNSDDVITAVGRQPAIRSKPTVRKSLTLSIIDYVNVSYGFCRQIF